MLLTGVPALALILIAERLKFRAWWGYTIGAALVGVLAHSLVPVALPWTGGAPIKVDPAAGFAVLGAASGLVYWFVAVHGRDDEQPLPVEKTHRKESSS